MRLSYILLIVFVYILQYEHTIISYTTYTCVCYVQKGIDNSFSNYKKKKKKLESVTKRNLRLIRKQTTERRRWISHLIFNLMTDSITCISLPPARWFFLFFIFTLRLSLLSPSIVFFFPMPFPWPVFAREDA